MTIYFEFFATLAKLAILLQCNNELLKGCLTNWALLSFFVVVDVLEYVTYFKEPTYLLQTYLF